MKEKEEARLIKLKELEKEFFDKGVKYVAGIDEAGRGPLAGPVVVACVMLDPNSMIEGVNDSKKISENKREKLYEIIIKEAISYGVGIVYEDEIDKINILQATKKGVTMAISQMAIKPNIIMVDALTGIDTIRNTIQINNKRRRKKLFNRSSFNCCKSYKR